MILEKGESPNVVNVRLNTKDQKEFWFLLRGDVHHDNPKSNRDLEKKHLDEAMECGAGILDCGDLFCAMQGAFDRRSSKNDLRPEHMSGDYLDSLVRTAADFYEPYAHNIVCLGKGNHECHDDTTEVLTEAGWMLFKDVEPGSRVGTMNLQTEMFEWQVPTRTVDMAYQGDLVVGEGKTYSFAVTPNHDIVYRDRASNVWKKMSAEKFMASSHRAVNIPVACGISESEYSVSDGVLRLLGLLLTDGSVTKGKQEILFFQAEEYADHVRGILADAGVTDFTETVVPPVSSILRSGREIHGSKNIVRWYVRGEDRLRLVSLVSGKREIPDWFSELSTRQVQVFMDGVIFGDGSDWGDPDVDRHQVFGLEKPLKDMQILLIKKGIRASVKEYRPGEWLLNVCLKKRITVVQQEMRLSAYDGRVYCFTVPNGTLITRRNGKVLISGNSGIYKHHETDLTERLAQTLRDRTGAVVPVTGYTGWVRFLISNGTSKTATTLWHMHGYGGGGPVTKDTIQAQRQHAYVEGADILWSGHVHERWCQEHVKVALDNRGKVKHRSIWYIKSGTYKEEYGSGKGGWHIETGKPPKPLGAWWLKLTMDRDRTKGEDVTRALVEITPTSGG